MLVFRNHGSNSSKIYQLFDLPDTNSTDPLIQKRHEELKENHWFLVLEYVLFRARHEERTTFLRLQADCFAAYNGDPVCKRCAIVNGIFDGRKTLKPEELAEQLVAYYRARDACDSSAAIDEYNKCQFEENVAQYLEKFAKLMPGVANLMPAGRC